MATVPKKAAPSLQCLLQSRTATSDNKYFNFHCSALCLLESNL